MRLMRTCIERLDSGSQARRKKYHIGVVKLSLELVTGSIIEK